MKIVTVLLLSFCFVSLSSAQSIDLLYQTHCSHCHGTKFQGGNAQSLVDGVWQFGSKRSQITHNIKFGITQLGMPAYEKTLSDQQVQQLADFLIDAEKRAGATPPSTPSELQTLDYMVDVKIIAKDLTIPWSISFIDSNTALVTERPGRLRIIKNGTLDPSPIKGIPNVVPQGQGGLLDVAIDPQYTSPGNQWIYLAYSHGLADSTDRRSPAMTKIVRGRIKEGQWTDEQTLFEAPRETYRTTRHHYGSRIVFDPEGYLYFGIGDRGAGDHAQNLSKPNGKIHRIHTNGTIPADNPFIKTPGALPSIYSYGHRNPQGLSVHPITGQVWESEHGPLGGDELNLIRPGLNYGWPVITYGKNYNGSLITDIVRKEGMEQPVYYWHPSTAVCGMEFYAGNLFSKWNNRLLVGALKYEDVRVLNIENDRVMHEEVILKNAGRVRDVTCAPDGAIYVVLNEPDIIIRLTPKSSAKQ